MLLVTLGEDVDKLGAAFVGDEEEVNVGVRKTVVVMESGFRYTDLEKIVFITEVTETTDSASC